MSVIKIQSSNIYGIEDNNSLIKQNKITKAEVATNDFKKENGNVLSKEYIITYWQETQDPTTGATSIRYVGNDTLSNDFLFTQQPVNDDIYAVAESENIRFDIGKFVLISFMKGATGNQYVSNYILKRRARYKYYDGDTEKTTYGEVSLPEYPLVYNSNDFTFSCDPYWIDGKMFSTLVFDHDDIIVTDEKTGEIVKRYYTERYILSETITIEGIYYTPQQIVNEYGMGTTVGFKLPTNELVQASNLIGENNLTSSLLESITRKYRSGKETYKLKCSIGDYYYTHGSLAIFPLDDAYENKLPATFKKHDIVEPWIYTSKGEVPLSEKADGTAKQFEVIGIDYSYAGVVWQELTLQEYIE